jgi:hypothetical protein
MGAVVLAQDARPSPRVGLAVQVQRHQEQEVVQPVEVPQADAPVGEAVLDPAKRLLERAVLTGQWFSTSDYVISRSFCCSQRSTSASAFRWRGFAFDASARR